MSDVLDVLVGRSRWHAVLVSAAFGAQNALALNDSRLGLNTTFSEPNMHHILATTMPRPCRPCRQLRQPAMLQPRKPADLPARDAGPRGLRRLEASALTRRDPCAPLTRPGPCAPTRHGPPAHACS